MNTSELNQSHKKNERSEDGMFPLGREETIVKTSVPGELIRKVIEFSKSVPQDRLKNGNVLVEIGSAKFVLQKLGTDYGGWIFPVNKLSGDSVCYCVGAGEDIGFDVELINKFRCDIFIFDPTPRAQSHVEMLKERVRRGEKMPINNSPADFYDLGENLLDKIKFFPYGIWSKTEVRRFFAPQNPEHVSHSITNLQKTDDGFDAQCLTVDEAMRRLGHKKVDLLKLDVEGAEYGVIDSIIESGIRVGILCIEFHTPTHQNLDERVENSIKKLLKAHFIPVFADVRNYTFVNADEYLQDRTPLCAKTSSENLGLTGRRLNAAKQERKNCDTFKIKLFDSEPGEVIAAKQVVKSYYLSRLKDVWQNHNSPVWFDHEIDYHMWPKNLFWIERGVFGRITMTPGCRVLDLCCGDGYFSDVWYSTIAGRIDACDNDSDALNFAAQKHSNERIRYHRVDVLADALPGTNYDVVTWFAAIEHFTEDQIVYILQKINSSLNQKGRLIGSTILVEQIGGLRNSQHKREFTSQNDLANVLRRVFTNSHTWVSAYPERLECFFQCGK